MNLPLIFLLPEKLHHKLMFICPTCSSQTFVPSTTELETLQCRHCGDIHDAQNAQLEILAESPKPPSLAGRNLREITLPRPEPGKP